MLESLKKLCGLSAIHLGVMKLEGDGQCGAPPMSFVSAPTKERVVVDAGVLVDDVV